MSKKKQETLKDYCPWLGFDESVSFYDRDGSNVDVFDYSLNTPVAKVEKHYGDYFVFLDVKIQKKKSLDNEDVFNLQQELDGLLSSNKNSEISVNRNLLEMMFSSLNLLSEYMERACVEREDTNFDMDER